MGTNQRMQQAIAYARNGKRFKSRILLRKIVHTHPNHEQAWLWLSYVAVQPTEKIHAAEQALALNPDNTTLHQRIETLKLKQIRTLKRKQAIPLLLDFVQRYEHNEQGWLLISDLVDDIEDQVFALEKVAELNPNNHKAQQRLKELHALEQTPLKLGYMYEERGDMKKASEIYQHAYATVTNTERDEINLRLASIRSRQRYYDQNITRPTLTVLRLSMGTITFYFFMTFIQVGIEPRNLTVLPMLGIVSVCIGSFLSVITRAKPKPPLWYTMFRGYSVTNETTMRLLLSIFGIILIIIPFIILLYDSVERIVRLFEQYIQ